MHYCGTYGETMLVNVSSWHLHRGCLSVCSRDSTFAAIARLVCIVTLSFQDALGTRKRRNGNVRKQRLRVMGTASGKLLHPLAEILLRFYWVN